MKVCEERKTCIYECDTCAKFEEINNRELELHNKNMKFSSNVETVWSDISKSWNMDFLLMNYVEVNEFKLCIERALDKIN